jgi:hypothetical protein
MLTRPESVALSPVIGAHKVLLGIVRRHQVEVISFAGAGAVVVFDSQPIQAIHELSATLHHGTSARWGAQHLLLLIRAT